MSNPALAAFDPFATHPFTAGATSPAPRRPPPTRAPVPSPDAAPAPSSAASPSGSLPVVQSPQPRQPSSSQPYTQQKQSGQGHQPIFTPFKLERASPELRDVLAKKKGNAWPAKPVYAAGASGKQ